MTAMLLKLKELLLIAKILSLLKLAIDQENVLSQVQVWRVSATQQQ